MNPSIVYDAIASTYARHRGAMDFVVDVLKRLHAESPGGSLLEVGCGTGAYVTSMAAATSCTAFGMDPSHRMLERAPTPDRAVYLQGHADRLPIDDRSLDMIFSVNVVHHIEDVGPYLGESFRVLRPGGILCTATDSQAIIERRKPLSRYWPSTVPVELTRYHDIDTLRDQMQAAGFRHIDECQKGSEFTVSDIGPYRDKAYSCLQLIPEQAFTRGLLALESDLRAGSVAGNSELTFLWGRHP